MDWQTALVIMTLIITSGVVLVVAIKEGNLVRSPAPATTDEATPE